MGLADGNHASVGATILTRRNDRRLAISATDWVKNGDRWTVTAIRNGSISARHTTSGLHVNLPLSYVTEHVELGYASTVHTARGLTADTMHGIANGDETRQMLYTMMTRGWLANHIHLAVGGDGDPHEMLRPETTEPATATEMLEAILARDGAAVSATATAGEAASPAVQLHDAVTRYADSMLAAAEDVIGTTRLDVIAQQAEGLLPGLTDAPAWASLSAQLLRIEADGYDAREALTTAFDFRPLNDADDAALVLGWRLTNLYPANMGPLPWVPAIPDRLARHPNWGTYLEERADRVDDLVELVRVSTNGAPGWLPNDVDLPLETTKDVTVWRAAHGIPDGDHRPTGPQQPDFTIREHQRLLDQRVSQHLDRQSAAWLTPVTEVVGRRDSHTSVLAERLAKLAQQGHDVHRLLERAGLQGALPDDHATAALDSRITGLVADEKRAAPGRPQSAAHQPPRMEPSRNGPGLGF